MNDRARPTSWWLRARIGLLLCLFAYPALAACGNTTGDEADTTASGFPSTGADLHDRLVTVGELVSSCMREEGFDLVMTPVPDPQWLDGILEASALGDPQYVLKMTSDQATEFAFGIADKLEFTLSGTAYDPFPIPDLDGDVSAVSPLETEYLMALYGNSSEDDPGCLAEAEATVGPVQPRIAEEGLEEAFDRLAADPEYIRLADRWSECTLAAGFDLGSHPAALGPIELAIQEEIEGFDSSESADLLAAVRSYETEAAQAHVRCLEQEQATIDQLLTTYIQDVSG